MAWHGQATLSKEMEKHGPDGKAMEWSGTAYRRNGMALISMDCKGTDMLRHKMAKN